MPARHLLTSPHDGDEKTVDADKVQPAASPASGQTVVPAPCRVELPRAAIENWVEAAMHSRREQGLSRSITDAKTLDRVAFLLQREDRKGDSNAA